MSMALGVSWVTNLFVSLSFLSLIDATNLQSVFFGFSMFSIAGVVFVFWLVPETKGRAVQDIVASLSK